MGVKKFSIKSIQDIKDFFWYLLDELHCAFHPEDSFVGFINKETGQPSFTAKEAIILDETMAECFELCEQERIDIYELAYDQVVAHDALFDYIMN